MRHLLERGVYFKVCGKRKREVGLVVPGCYRARTNRKKVAEILSQEIKKIKERYPYFELYIEQDAVRKPLSNKMLCANHCWSNTKKAK